MTEKENRLRILARKPRSNSYRGSLTEKQLAEVQSILCAPGVSLVKARELVPLMRPRKGEEKGKQPSAWLLSRLRSQLKLEEVAFKVEVEATVFEDGFARFRSAAALSPHQEKLLDEAMGLIGREVIDKTLRQMSAASRTAAARLLLKRADQRRVDRKQDFIEAQAKKKEPPPPALPLTYAEKKAAVRKILGISS